MTQATNDNEDSSYYVGPAPAGAPASQGGTGEMVVLPGRRPVSPAAADVTSDDQEAQLERRSGTLPADNRDGTDGPEPPESS